MMIAAGWREIRQDASENGFVMFDKGNYKVSDKAQIEHSDGKDWVWCEAHVDPDTQDGYATIGGVRMELAYNPEQEDNDDDR